MISFDVGAELFEPALEAGRIGRSIPKRSVLVALASCYLLERTFDAILRTIVMNTDIVFEESVACSDFLFARPTFVEGAARLFDFAGALNQYNESKTGSEADAIALRMDMRMVGADLWAALRQLLDENARRGEA